MWFDLGHLQLMLSWPALHISSPYTVGLNIQKVRNCLVTVDNCCCTLCTCQPMSQHIIRGLLPILQQSTHNCSIAFQKTWPSAQALLISITAHTACLYIAYQVTTINPLTQVHAFCQHQLAQCLTQHIIIIVAQHCLALKPPSPHTKQSSARPALPCTILQGQHHLLLPNIKIRFCPPWPSSAMAQGHHVEQGASTCCPSSCLSF